MEANDADAVHDLVWPPGLDTGHSSKLIYLDLNHWISLAKAGSGHRHGDQFLSVLESCRQAKQRGSASFPLSAAHYMEMTKIKDPRQRNDLATVMEELSGFSALLSRAIVVRLEMEAAADQILGTSNPRPERIPLVGFGFSWALGFPFSLVLSGEHDKLEIDQILDHAKVSFERGMLAGPSDEDLPDLRRGGWNPEATFKVMEARAIQEQEQSSRLDLETKWRRGRLRDIVSVRELAIEHWEELQSFVADRGNARTLMEDRRTARRFVGSMPSWVVATELKTSAHRNPNTRWDANTIFDIDALSLAVPYCQVVVTEKHAHATLTRAKLDKRMSTVLLRRLEDLVGHL